MNKITRKMLSTGTTLSRSYSDLLQHAHALLLVLTAQHPKLIVLVFHDVGEHGAAQEHHVLPTRRVLDFNLEFLEEKNIALRNTSSKKENVSNDYR